MIYLRSTLGRSLIIAVLFLLMPQSSVSAEEIRKTAKVGPVTAELVLSPTELRIGDEVTLQLDVRADAGVEVILPEFGEAVDGFSIVEFIPRERVDTEGVTNYSQKYVLQPARSGDHSIAPILIEFVDHRPGQQASPEDFDAFELLTERIDFEVLSGLDPSASLELKPLAGELEPLEAPLTGAWWVSGAVVLILVVGGCVLLAWLRRWRVRTKRENAYVLAWMRLQRLIEAREAQQFESGVDAFYVEISAIVRRYVEDRFGLRAPDLTTDEFMQVASGEESLSADHQELLSEFLRQADIVKFAAVSASESDVERSISLAKRFLDETRENAPDVEVRDEPSLPAREASHV